jgi:uncharacterized membrane protein
MAPVTRIQSIDFLRGIVMVLMVLDHTRTFLHGDFKQFNAEDLAQTTPVLFFTRWITHFCAPVFIFLTGTSAYLFQQKGASRKKVAGFLLSRGLILIFLELTIFRICWVHGDFFASYIGLLVIWTIGISMIFLAALIFLPYRVILVVGMLIMFLHNMLAGISFPEDSAMAIVWAGLYSGGGGMLFGKIYLYFLFPVIPYLGLIALGYCLGYLYGLSFTQQRRRIVLLAMGITCVLLFLILRYFNIYGDPRPWGPGKNVIFSIMDFLKTNKYPISLLYALMTIGPSLIILALIEPVHNKLVSFFALIGSVPLFYYILHLPILALLGAIIGYNKVQSLAMVYVWFAVIVAVLYMLSRWYARYKFTHPDKKWLRYL